MKISKIGKCFVIGTVAIAGISVLAMQMSENGFLTRALGLSNVTDYTLKFTSSNAPTSTDMAHHTIYTALGNPIDVTYENCEVASGKHVKINAGGEVILNTQLKGVYGGSARYTGSLKVWCGLEPDQMWEADISESTTEFFSTYQFNYIKLVALTDVELEAVDLNYSCIEAGPQKSTLQNVTVAPGTLANYSPVQMDIGTEMYFGAKGLGNNAVTVKVNNRTITKGTSGAYEFPLGPKDVVSVESDFDINDGVNVNCYNISGDLIETTNVKYTSYNDFSGTIYAPVQEDLVANTSTRKVLLDKAHQTIDVYYSEISAAWDGTSASSAFVGDGSSTSPYLIQSGEDLKLLADSITSTEKYTGKFFKLTKSIDLGDHALTIGQSTTIGFDGTLDGNNCSIRGLKSSNGLFNALLAHGTVKNLSLYGEINNTAGNTVTTSSPFVVNAVAGSKITNCFNFANLNITSSDQPGTGGHAGFIGKGNATISNCENYGNMLNKTNKRYYTGGIVGVATGTMTIQNAVNWGIVSGGTGTGGIVGCQAGSNVLTVNNCKNFGTVESIYTTANNISGGIVGAPGASTRLTINGCQNYGHIIGNNYSETVRATQFGGIFGGTFSSNLSVDIKSCENFGEVEADYIVGGIYGGSSNSAVPVTVDGCTNYGYVHSNGHGSANTLGYAGGITGWVRSTTSDTITNCVNWGEVESRYAEVSTAKGGSGSAGICSFTGGATHVNIDTCFNYGYIHNPTGYAGGVISGTTTAAANLTMEITNCINYGTIQSAKNVGGIIGIISVGSTPENCANHGLLIGNSNVGDIIGYDARK